MKCSKPAAWIRRSGAVSPSTKAPGCIECAGTGFRGRTAIHELLDLSDRIREMILEKKPTSEIRKRRSEEGMQLPARVGAGQSSRGLTTLKEINKVTFIEASGSAEC